MDTRRLVLYAVLGLIMYSLWSSWQHDYAPSPVGEVVQNTTPINTTNALLPNLPSTGADVSDSAVPAESLKSTDKQHPIQVKTDVLSLMIDPTAGDIVQTSLLHYPINVNEPNKPIELLYDEPARRYVASSNLVIAGKTVAPVDINYDSTQTYYEMTPGLDSLIVTLKGKTKEGLLVDKIFTFTRGSYLVKVSYAMRNESATAWKGYLNTQLIQSAPSEDSSSIFHVGSFTGASYSNPEKSHYQKISYKAMDKANLTVAAKGGWVAMQQHYFLSAWVPQANSENTLYTRAVNGSYTIGMVGQPIVLDATQEKTITMGLYLGPEDTAVLKAIAPGLDLTVDYGWLWFLSSALFSVMKAIHSVVGNWGWSIVLVTVFVKLAFYRLSARSYRSMAGMRKLQPKLQALRERYGDDKTKISQATMALYKEEKVNPLGGCLPVVIQIPVFIALYWVLLESVALRQAPFIFWINDLAVADPYPVLPIIMGITMLLRQRLNPAPPDPMQAKIMMFLPVLFTGLFWNFPAGLVLYWIVNNTLSILQQWYITNKYSATPPARKNKRLVSVK